MLFVVNASDESDESDDSDDSNFSIDSLYHDGSHRRRRHDGDITVPRLVDIMPASLQQVTFNCDGHEESLAELFENLAEEKDVSLPALEKVTYCGRTMDDEVKEELKAAGIRIGRKKWPFKPQHVAYWEKPF